jgi:peptidoglycan/LPS O-acetylase OafA/YrhL
VTSVAVSARAPKAIPASTPSRRFAALDGLRGVAAVAVVLYHIGTATGRARLAPHGYLAVDFFFVLSGFVLAYAYGERLESGAMTARGFLLARYRRLWPTALIGAVMGFAVLLATHAPVRLAHGFWLAATLNLMLLPNLTAGIPSMYPLNPPHWSLLYELAANFLYAIVAPRLTNRMLGAVVLLSGVGLAVTTAHAHGGGSLSLWRVAYGFPVGILLSRAWVAGYRPTAASLALVLIVIAAFTLSSDSHPALLDGALALVVFPLVVWYGASAAVGPHGERIAAFVGRASYPIYALHYPFIMLMF